LDVGRLMLIFYRLRNPYGNKVHFSFLKGSSRLILSHCPSMCHFCPWTNHYSCLIGHTLEFKAKCTVRMIIIPPLPLESQGFICIFYSKVMDAEKTKQLTCHMLTIVYIYVSFIFWLRPSISEVYIYTNILECCSFCSNSACLLCEVDWMKFSKSWLIGFAGTYLSLEKCIQLLYCRDNI
jgi:hypothetical protein